MKIIEVIAESKNTKKQRILANEAGVLSTVGRSLANAASSVVGGLKGMGTSFMKGVKAGKRAVAGGPTPSYSMRKDDEQEKEQLLSQTKGVLSNDTAQLLSKIPPEEFIQLVDIIKGHQNQPVKSTPAEPATKVATTPKVDQATPSATAAKKATKKATKKARASMAPKLTTATEPETSGDDLPDFEAKRKAGAEKARASMTLKPATATKSATKVATTPKVDQATLSATAAKPATKVVPSVPPADYEYEGESPLAAEKRRARRKQKDAEKAQASMTSSTTKPATAAKKATKKAAEIEADRERLIQVQSDSVIRKGAVVAESFSSYRKKTT